MGTVRNILQTKGNAVYTVSPESSVYELSKNLKIITWAPWS
jgi:hypothetical protein